MAQTAAAQSVGRGALVSVYVPTRGRPALLQRAVRSALSQTYRNVEVVVALDRADEGARQATADLLDESTFAGRVRVIRSNGSGACAARNAAIREARGPLITGLDDDDYLEPSHVEALVEAFDPARHGFAFTGYRWLSRAPGGQVREGRVTPASLLATPARLLRKNVVGNQIMTLTARMRESGGFDEELQAWQDHDLWLRLARLYGPGLGVPGSTYVCDQISATDRISADAARIDSAMLRFTAKYTEYEDRRLRAFLHLARARYGDTGLSFRDVLRIAALEGISPLAAEAILIYAGWAKPSA